MKLSNKLRNMSPLHPDPFISFSPGDSYPKLAGVNQDDNNDGMVLGGLDVLSTGDVLDRLYRLQSTLHSRQHQHELHLEDELDFTLTSMRGYLQDGLLQIIALNALSKLLMRVPGVVVEMALHKEALVVVGEVMEAHHDNDLIQDTAKRLMALLMGDDLDDEDQGLYAPRGATNNSGAERKYLPYRVNRMNSTYIRHMLPSPSPQQPIAQHHRQPSSPKRSATIRGLPRQAGSRSPPPVIQDKEGQRQPLPAPIKEVEQGEIVVAACAGHQSVGEETSPKLVRVEGAPPSPIRHDGTRAVTDSPLELSRHPTVKKIFIGSQRSRKRLRGFSPMRDTMQLFQILDEENSGLLPRHKFDKGLLCLGLGVSEEEVRAMLKDLNVGADDLVDYELFCSSGKVLCAQLMPAPALPVKPWIRRMKNYATVDEGTMTWSGHIEWFRKRKAKAAIWLIRKGLKAKQMERERHANQLVLLQVARRAFAVTYLRERVASAKQHLNVQIRQCDWLAMRVRHARKTKEKHQEAQRYLVRRAKRALALPLPQVAEFKAPKVNYQSLYRLQWQHNEAFKFLRAKGEAAVRRVFEQIEHRRLQKQVFKELRDLGRKALGMVDVRAQHPLKHSDTQDKLAVLARRKMDFLERKEEDAEWLMDRAKRARDHVDRQTQAFHKNCGQAERVLRAWGAREVALEWLMGKRPKAFEVRDRKEEAILYLLDRAYKMFDFFRQQELAADFLRARVLHARAHMKAQAQAFDQLKARAAREIYRLTGRIEAFAYLKKKAKFAKEVNKIKVKATKDLRRMVDNIRAETHRTDLIIMYKDDLTKLRKSLKTEDKQRVELWSTMKLGADEIFQLKLKEAFDLYNIEETEEIGRIEFRYLVDNTHLVDKMGRDDFDEFFDMVDKDKSGRISFMEFEQWFSYELQRSGVNSKQTQQILAQPSFLPLDERALLTLMAKLRKGEIKEKEPIQSWQRGILDLSSLIGPTSKDKDGDDSKIDSSRGRSSTKKLLQTSSTKKVLGRSLSKKGNE